VLYFANPSTDAIRAAMTAGKLGCIITPKQGQAVPPGAVFIADNGRGPGRKGGEGKGWPGADQWWAWVQSLPRERCAFVVAPDVVGDAAATALVAEPWLPRIRGAGFHVAYVAQDGMQQLPDPATWDALFIGGSTAWKLGPDAARLVAAARELGKPVHMGRVNSRIRLHIALAFGCTSVDGTLLTFGPDKHLPPLLRWLADLRTTGAQTAILTPHE
jgi:hypothetical protein